MQADKKTVIRLLKTVRGQIDGILKMVEEDQYCVDISNQVMASQAVLRRVNREIIRAHMEHCVREALAQGDEAAAKAKMDEMTGILDKLLKD